MEIALDSFFKNQILIFAKLWNLQSCKTCLSIVFIVQHMFRVVRNFRELFKLWFERIPRIFRVRFPKIFHTN